jgi:hypothetical protein
LGKGLKPERNFMDRPGKNVILLLLLLIVVFGSEFCLGQKPESNKPITTPIEWTRQAVSESNQPVTLTSPMIAATPTFTPTGHVMSSEEVFEYNEMKAINKAREEVEKQLIWKYGSIIKVILTILSIIFSLFCIVITAIITIIINKIHKGLIKIQEFNKWTEEMEKRIEKYSETIEKLKTDVEELEKSAKEIDEKIRMQNENADLFKEGQYVTNEDLLKMSKDLDSKLIRILNLILNIAKEIKNQDDIKKKIHEELKSNEGKFEKIKESIQWKRFPIKILTPDREKLNEELISSGFFTQLYPVAPRIDFKAIWIGRNVPIEVVVPVLTIIRKNQPFLRYLAISGDMQEDDPNDPNHNCLIVGGDFKTVNEKGLKPLSDKDFDELLSKKTKEEMHAFIRKFYPKEEN